MAKQTENLELQEVINKYFPFFAEIRKRIFFIASIFFIGGIIGFFYYEKIIKFTIALLDLKGINVVFTSPFQFLNLAVNSALVVGIIVAFPFTIAQLLSFLKPALRKKEYKTIITLLPLSIILFVFGFSYGTLMMKYMLVLFYEKSLSLNIGNFLDISNLLSKIILTSTLMGLAFQFPIILTVLMKFKIITHKALKKQRFIAWSVALIFAAFMPPTDILSLMLLTLPLVILFETTLIFNRVMKT